MSPVKTEVNVGRWLDERDQANVRLVRSLAEQGRLDLIDAIYGEDGPSILCASSPRLKAVAQ
jgi:hypothetical protein